MKTRKTKIHYNSKTRKHILNKKPRLEDDYYSYINYLWVKKISHSKNKQPTMDLVIRKKVNHELKNVVLKKLLEEKTRAGEQIRHIYNASTHWNADLTMQKFDTMIKKLEHYRTNAKDVYEFMGWFVKEGNCFPIGWDIEIDARANKTYVSHLTEYGLTFMNKDIYFSTSKKYRIIRKKYISFLKNIFQIAFGKNHQYNVNKIFETEKKIAELLMTQNEVLYVKNIYNAFNHEKCLKDLDLDWQKFSGALGFKIPPKKVIVENPKYVKHVMDLLKNWKDQDFHSYWIYQILITASKHHYKLFQEFNDFNGKLDNTQLVKIDLQETALTNIKNYMNTHISKKYIELFKNEKEIAYATKIAERFIATFKRRINENNWLHSDTKKKSLQKLDNITFVVGYKPHWENDPKIEFSPTDSWENFRLFTQFSHDKDVNLVGKPPLPKNTWTKTEDQNVYDMNAYYISSENELILPNSILQPPFVDVEKDMTYNLATLGTTIGHEITHAFDDDGYYYDENGMYVPGGWWKEADMQSYKRKQEKIVEQYEKAGKQDNIKLDGNLTLTENIADIGGFLLAEEVLIEYLNEKQIYGEKQDKYLKEFYENFATLWRSNKNIKTYKKNANDDEHSYAKYRINSLMSNSKHFQRIFNIQKGDKMYLDITEIW
jgi:predicted metalloendopeptidase